jgi:putative copper resistance protein D
VAGFPAHGGQQAAAQSLPELTGGRFPVSWEWDFAAVAFVVVLGGAYGWAVLRLRRRGERWPVARTAAFGILGLGTIVFATMSALAVYDRILFWPAAVQNILLDLIAPIGLALGDPLSLAYRALPSSSAQRLRGAMTGRVVRALTFPLVSSALVIATELGIYFTPYFGAALRHSALHEVMYLHLLLAGCLFVLPMLSREEMLPSWCSHPVRAALVFLDGIFDAIPGVVVMTSGTLIAGSWYRSQARTWGPDVQLDQMIGGGAMISIAELVGLVFLIAVFAEWVRAERVKTAELDRRLDAEQVRAAPRAPSSPVAEPDRVRPWWETDTGVVGQRIRGSSGRPDETAPPRT